MAQMFQTDDGNLITPGAYAKVNVQAPSGGTGTNGVLVLIGEADQGPSMYQESELNANRFGPSQSSDVAAKYGSGPLVDAFNQAVNPSNDNQIKGAPQAVVLVKTNTGGQATLSLSKISGGTYGVFADATYGKLGSLLFGSIAQAAAEVVPSTTAFTWIPPTGAVSGEMRVNGGAAAAFSTLAQATPASAATSLAVAGVTVTGGTDRTILNGLTTPTVAVTASGTAAGVIFTLGGNPSWATIPSVGDTLFIPAATALSTANATLGGSYVVTSATATAITATKLANNTAGVVTVPTTQAAVTVTSAAIAAYAPITVSVAAGAVVDGLGKSLEIADLTGNILGPYALSATPVTWLSTTATPTNIASSAEYQVTAEITRQVDSIDQIFTIGGDVALKIGYKGTTASVTISPTQISGTSTGGTGSHAWGPINLADYPTINDLVAFIGAQSGWSAAAGSAAMGQYPSVGTDEATFNCGSTLGALNGRIKADAAKFYTAVTQNMSKVQQYQWDATAQAIKTVSGVKQNGAASAGLPAVMTATPFATVGRGGTTAQNIADAFAKCESVRANFVCTCFAQDAATDALAGITDPSSNYTIDAINTGLRSHVNKMSQFKRRRPRQGFGAKRGTFAVAKAAAQNLASYRTALAFQDVMVLSNAGTIKQFQPWMLAVTAAGMQAAGFYKASFNKQLNITGVLQAAGDFTDLNGDQVDDALSAGLIVVKRPESGGFTFASDQTTYSKDSNFVYNSWQAVYMSDILARTTSTRMQDALVGQVFADMPPSVAMSAFDRVMQDLVAAKVIFPTTDAPRGYKNAKIVFSGPAAQVTAEANLDTAIYFVPIAFNIQQVTQTATA